MARRIIKLSVHLNIYLWFLYHVINKSRAAQQSAFGFHRYYWRRTKRRQVEDAGHRVPLPPTPSSQHLSLWSRHSNANDRDEYLQSLYFPLEDSFPEETDGLDRTTLSQKVVPILAPILAFNLYESTADCFSSVMDASQKFSPLDGGSYQAKIIAPAVNGVVVPSVAILFATLTSTTISTLRQRQVDIRKAINMEAGELRVLDSLVDSFPTENGVRSRCRNYLIQYTSRILAESNPTDEVDRRRKFDSELNGFLTQLNEVHDKLPAALAGEAYGAITRLRGHRIERISALQSTYPPLHFALLAVLALSICICFLVETNQDILLFLNALELKILWSLLVGTFVSCFSVFYDLSSPFGGIYRISKSVDQLQTVQLALRASKDVPP